VAESLGRVAAGGVRCPAMPRRVNATQVAGRLFCVECMRAGLVLPRWNGGGDGDFVPLAVWWLTGDPRATPLCRPRKSSGQEWWKWTRLPPPRRDGSPFVRPGERPAGPGSAFVASRASGERRAGAHHTRTVAATVSGRRSSGLRGAAYRTLSFQIGGGTTVRVRRGGGAV
jgi:hypothetical protein